MKNRILIVAVLAALLCIGVFGYLGWRSSSSKPNGAQERVSFRLLWVPQAQFAGVLVADKKGFFKEEGIEMEIRAAGPDLKPHVTVASGSDDMGITVSNSIISANSNGADLIAVAQEFQDSANRYVAKTSSGLRSLTDVRGKKVGLWTGGDEVEFIAMLKKVGMNERDVVIVPQGFSVTPFLQGDYAVSMVTTYNELNQIRKTGVKREALRIFSPADYGCAIVGDVIFTRRSYAEKHPQTVEKVLRAILRGWQYARDNPNEAVDLVLSYNKELDRSEQLEQLKAVLDLVYARSAKSDGIGYISKGDYETVQRILLDSGQIKQPVDVNTAIDLSYWQQAKKVLNSPNN